MSITLIDSEDSARVKKQKLKEIAEAGERLKATREAIKRELGETR